MRVLRQLTAEERTEFERIGHNKYVREYLESSLAAVKDRLVGVPADEDFRKLQGQAQVLNELVEAINNGKR